MATIKVQGLAKSPKDCRGRKAPSFVGGYYEFPDASEEELAFWNTMNDRERSELAKDAEKRCFFELLHDVMKKESKKAEGQEIKDRQLAGGNQPNPQSPVSPPDSPPTPRTPEQPPPPTL